jgi:hypothetical protein
MLRYLAFYILIGSSLLLLSFGCATGPDPMERPVEKPLVPYKGGKTSELTFAEISYNSKNSHVSNTQLDISVGILPVQNDFWSIADPHLDHIIDYSGYSVDLCNCLKRKLVSSGVFSGSIELPHNASEMIDKGEYEAVSRLWDVQSILCGRVLDSTGRLQLCLHLTDGTKIFDKVFSDCWHVNTAIPNIIQTIQADPCIIEYTKTDSNTGLGLIKIIKQPAVKTSTIIFRLNFMRKKIYAADTMRVNSVPGALAALIFKAIEAGTTKAEGQLTEGEIVASLDGISLGEKIAPTGKEFGKLIYDWQKEVAVRPGKHRVIFNNVTVMHAAGYQSYKGDTPYVDFDVKDGDQVTVTFKPVYNKGFTGERDWSLGVERWEIETN